jgi:hypothetical protein
MTHALNTPRGRVIDALFNHALRVCRLSDKVNGSHSDVWLEMQSVFEDELDKCQNSNFEFSTFCGCYIANLDYVDHQWLQTNFDKIFPALFDDNFRCALEGLAYAPASKSIYSLLKEFSIIEKALSLETAGKYSREKMVERLCLAYLWGAEDLQSGRFSLLFQTYSSDDLLDATQWFWGIRGETLSDDQIERILSFWERCISWSENTNLVSDKLLSKLSLLTCYLRSISPLQKQLLFAVAPYVHINYNADHFIKELGRLVENNPDEVCVVLGKVLETYRPSYDFEDKIKNLLLKLIEKGNRAAVILYAERLRDLPGMPEFYAQIIRS